MSNYGYHWTPCRRGGGGVVAALIVLAVLAVAVWRAAVRAGHAVEHGTDVLRHTTWEAMEVTAMVIGSAAALAAVAGMAYGARRLYTWQARNRQAIARHTPAVQHVSCTISAPRPGAIEAPHHLITGQKPAGYTTADLHARPGVSRPATTKED